MLINALLQTTIVHLTYCNYIDDKYYSILQSVSFIFILLPWVYLSPSQNLIVWIFVVLEYMIKKAFSVFFPPNISWLISNCSPSTIVVSFLQVLNRVYLELRTRLHHIYRVLPRNGRTRVGYGGCSYAGGGGGEVKGVGGWSLEWAVRAQVGKEGNHAELSLVIRYQSLSWSCGGNHKCGDSLVGESEGHGSCLWHSC